MNRVGMLRAIVLLGVASGCSEAPIEPVPLRPLDAPRHSSAANCPLASLPTSANVVLCFTTTLQPGVWHGWILELSDAQPPATGDGTSDTDRLNHDYVLVSPEGYTRWESGVPLAPLVNIYAFQAEFNGSVSVWFDVLRLHARQDHGPQTVPVVVFWADGTAVGGDINTAVTELLTTGVVNGGQANALTRKIDQASDLIARQKNAEAIQVLQSFIQQVRDLTYVDLVLSPAQGDQLIAWAEYMIAFI